MNQEIFQSVLAPEIAPLFRYLRRIGVREADIEDVVQEVLVTVGVRWSDYDSTRPLRPWLFAFASRVAWTWRRSARSTRESLASDAPDEPGDGALSAHDEVERKQRRQLVIDALQSLDEEQRVVFVMIELESMTAPEVAAALSLNLNTAYSRLRLARAAFTAAVRRLSAQRGAL